MLYRLVRFVLGLAFRYVWRPRIRGREHIPMSGPVLLASNHLSFIDSFVIPLAVPRRVTFLAKHEYFTGGGVRGRATALFMRSFGAVPVRRGHGQRQAMDALGTALEVLQDGGAFAIYPEGTRSLDGRLYRGRTGVGWLALESGAPIVPVALIGTERVQPVGVRVPRVHRVTIEFAAPVDPTPFIEKVAESGGAGTARREITDLVMTAIATHSGQQMVREYNHKSGAPDTPAIG